jgi:hypothetical protein
MIAGVKGEEAVDDEEHRHCFHHLQEVGVGPESLPRSQMEVIWIVQVSDF